MPGLVYILSLLSFMLAILSFIYGASIGSFVQVTASRLHVAPIVKARSKCLSRGETLRASDLIPVFSYLFLKGKCRYCKTSYGPEALVIEILFGLTFLLLYLLILTGQPTLFHSLGYLIYYTLLFMTLGVLALYDKAHSYVPALFLYFFFGLTGGMYILKFLESQSVFDLLSPLIVASPFALIWLITKGKGLGFGDVLIFLCVGLFFSPFEGLAVLMLSVWMGALYGLYVKFFIQKNTTNKTPIPFVPFIALAFLIVLFTGIDILSIASLFA